VKADGRICTGFLRRTGSRHEQLFRPNSIARATLLRGAASQALSDSSAAGCQHRCGKPFGRIDTS